MSFTGIKKGDKWMRQSLVTWHEGQWNGVSADGTCTKQIGSSGSEDQEEAVFTPGKKGKYDSDEVAEKEKQTRSRLRRERFALT